MTRGKTNNTHQSWCPRQGLELTRILCTSQTFVSNSWANSNRNPFIAFYSLYNTEVAPMRSLRSEPWLKRRRRIGPNMKERRVLHNWEETIMGDTEGTKFQHGREEKTEIIDFCLLGNAETAETMNSAKQSEEESEGGTKGERTASKEKFSHFPAHLQRSVTEWEDKRLIWDPEQNPTAGRKRTEQEGVCVIILSTVNGGEEVLELVCGEVTDGDVSSSTSTIVLPEAFPFGRSEENNCFHHLFFQFQDSDSAPAVSTPCFTSMVHLTFSPSPIPQPFPLFWALQNSLHQTIFSPNSFFLHSVPFLATEHKIVALPWPDKHKNLMKILALLNSNIKSMLPQPPLPHFQSQAYILLTTFLFCCLWKNTWSMWSCIPGIRS